MFHSPVVRSVLKYVCSVHGCEPYGRPEESEKMSKVSRPNTDLEGRVMSSLRTNVGVYYTAASLSVLLTSPVPSQRGGWIVKSRCRDRLRTRDAERTYGTVRFQVSSCSLSAGDDWSVFL